MSRGRNNPLTALARSAARWSAAHPWRAIAAWAGLVVVAVALAALVPTVGASEADYRIGDSGRAEQLVADAGLAEPDGENVVITAESGALDQSAARRAAARVSARVAELDGVDAVGEPQRSPDRSALLVPMQLARDGDDGDGRDELADAVRAIAADVQDDARGLVVRASGDATLTQALDERVADDLATAERTSLPVTLVLMLVAFGALIAAGLPVLLALSSVAATVGLLAPISHVVPAEPTVTSMVVLIGMAVGVDYSLFYLKREREERLAGHSTPDAVDLAAQTSGHAILVSGGAVIASMTGLFLMGDTTFNSLAVGAIVVVAVAVLGSITVLPALLGGLGRWVDRPRVPLLWRLNARIGRGGLSRRMLAPVVRRPGVALVVSGLLVGALALPALGLKVHASGLDTLPASIPEVQTMRDISAAFPGEGTVVDVVVRDGGTDQGAVDGALDRLRRDAVATGDVVTTGESAVRSGGVTLLHLGLPDDASDDRVDDAVRTLRDDLVPAAFAGTGAEVVVGGEAATSLDAADRVRSRLPMVIGFVLLLTFLMMLATFRSVVIAALSTVLNLASVGVAFGVLVVVFQHGVGEGLLGFDSTGFVIDWLPLFVMVVLVGLSMDYHVFVVSRIREHVASGLPTRVAVQRGVADTAGVVTSAATVMVSVFAIFATLSLLELKMMGVGLAAAILLDATLVRLVMLPAALVLLGERAWWPSRPVPTAPADDVRSVTPAAPAAPVAALPRA